MRKIITTGLFLLSILMAWNMKAQSSELLIDDFESGNKGWAVVSCYYDIRTNPHKEGINTSAHVLFTNRGTGNDNWSGAILSATALSGSPITGYRYLHAKMYRNNANNPQLKITDTNGAPEINPMSGITIVANKWQDVVFDIGANPVDYVMFMVDRTTPLAAEAQLLVDDIALSNDPTPREPAVIGSMIETDVPVYPQRDGAAPGTATGSTFDFKVVTVDATTYAWTNVHGLNIANNPWSSQYRYWSTTGSKTENNLLSRVAGTQETYGSTTTPQPNNPVTITFLQEQSNVFFETDDFTYDNTIANSADASDKEAPALADPTVVSQTGTQLNLSLSATDNSGNYFYYIKDGANNFSQVSFLDNVTLNLTAGINYNFSIYAVDFSGNMSEAKTVSVQGVEAVYFTEGVAQGISFKLDSRSLTELKIECTSNTADLIGDAFVKLEINGVQVMNGGDVKEWKPTIDQNTGTSTYQITVPAADIPGWAEGAVLTLNLGYITMPIGDWGHYVTDNSVITAGEYNGLPILHKIGTGVDINSEEPPTPPTYECNGTDILSGVDFQLAATDDATLGLFFATGNSWTPSTNYTAAWDNATGTLDLHLGDATTLDWQAQFPLKCTSQTLTSGKTYFVSFEIKTSVALPRVYMKLQTATDGNHFIEFPAFSLPAGADTIMSGLSTSTANAFDAILFDFGGNPANADITISNITVCDDYVVAAAKPVPVTLKVVDQSKGAITNKVDDNNETNIFCWIDDNLKSQNPRTPNDWWYPMYDESGVTPNGQLIKGDADWTWEITLNALPGTYKWNPEAKTLGWNPINPNMYAYTGDDADNNFIFTVSETGEISGHTQLVIPAPSSGPTEPATPTRDPSNVLSVYCNAYTNIAGINYNPGWNQPTQVNPNYAVGSSTLLQYTNFTYQGTEFPDQNVTDMTYLHIEVWSPTAFTTNIYPISHDPADDTKSYPLALQANQWNVFDIPLTAFAIPQYSIWQFKFDNGTGNTFYIANWYFYNENTTPDTEAPTNFTATKGAVTKNSVELLLNADDNSGAVFYTVKYGTPVQTVAVGGQSGVQRSYLVSGLNDNADYTFTITVKDRAGNANPNTLTVNATTPVDPLAQPTTAAPTPTALAENVMSVFSSAYTTHSAFNYGNWQQTTTHSTVQIAGVNTLKLENFNYQGFEFVGAGGVWDISGMDYLHVDVWTPNLTAFSLAVSGGLTVNCVPVNIEQWNSYDIPLTALAGGTLDFTDVQVMQFNGTGPVPAENTAYLENIYFYKDLTGISNAAINNATVVVGGKSSLSATFNGAATVSVYSVQGVLIKKTSAQSAFEIGNLPAGIYLVKVNNSVYKAIVK